LERDREPGEREIEGDIEIERES
jgi:hypothetical protein